MNDSVRNTRRDFLGKMGIVGAGALLGACAPVASSTQASTMAAPGRPNLDVAILNFALNLEYLEAAFYLAAVGRLGELATVGGDIARIALPNSDGFSSTNVGIATLSPAIRAYADEIATDELNHVRTLRGALGAAAVAMPDLDLNGSFTAAGNLASKGAITNFNPFANELFFLHGAFVFEDVGVTAYKGAARLVTDVSENGVLETAAGILAVEAYHAGAIRTLLYQQKDVVAAGGLTVAQIVGAISDLRDSVDGSTDLDQGIVNANGSANLVPTDANSVAFSRTTDQVLAIVYLGGKGKGGFFPNGLNGVLK